MTSTIPSTVIICVYFGPLPTWMPAWLKSCACNPKFNWLLVTDDRTDHFDVPANVRIETMSIRSFCDRMSNHLGFKISFTRPYKLNDFKPLYHALITAEEARRHQFWGHGDIDLIYGDLAAVLQPEWFETYDRILCLGHLSLYRNDDATNHAYRLPHPGIDWREILSDPCHRGFDEHLGVNRIWRLHHGKAYDNPQLVIDIDPQPRRFELVAPAKNYRFQTFFFEQGKVFHGYYEGSTWHTDEYLYAHFQKRSATFKALPRSLDRFYITREGLIDKAESVPSKEKVAQLNPPPALPSIGRTATRYRRYLKEKLKPNSAELLPCLCSSAKEVH